MLYTGEYRIDTKIKEGFGTLKTFNGQEVYSGDWQNDLFCGQGVLININQVKSDFTYKDFSTLKQYWTKYEGEFFNGLFNGLGTLIIANGEKFNGKFNNGIIDGDGTYYLSNNDVMLIGTWKNNKLIDVL